MTVNEPETTAAVEAQPNQVSGKVVRAWALWRWGTQPFNSVILTFVFVSLYLTSAQFSATSAGQPKIPCDNAINNAQPYCMGLAELASQWSAWNAVAGLLVLLFAPVLGARAEFTGGRKRWLLILTGLLALSQFLLVFVAPQPNWFAFGAITVAAGVVIVEISGVQINAMLHDVSTPETRGRVSGLGWGLGYVGGVVVLLISVVALTTSWFGLAPHNGMSFRLIGVFTAIWTIVFSIPLAKDAPEFRIKGAPKENFFHSYVVLVSDMIALHKQSKPTFWFLLASAVYRDGLAGVFAFGGILAAQAFGFTSTEVMIFGLALVTISGVSTILAGRLDDSRGSRWLIIVALSLLVAMALFVFAFAFAGKIILWIGGALLSAAVGPAQSASRTLLARLTPSSMQGEIFGLYATTGEVTGVLHPAIWTLFVVGFGATMFGVLGLAVLLGVGLVLFLLVKIPKDPENHTRFIHLEGWNEKVLIGLTILVFIGTAALIFGVTGAAYIPGGPGIASGVSLIAAIGAIAGASLGLREISTTGQQGAAIGRATIRVAFFSVAASVVFFLMQFGIIPVVRLS